jgi:hypothetical protein
VHALLPEGSQGEGQRTPQEGAIANAADQGEQSVPAGANLPWMVL